MQYYGLALGSRAQEESKNIVLLSNLSLPSKKFACAGGGAARDFSSHWSLLTPDTTPRTITPHPSLLMKCKKLGGRKKIWSSSDSNMGQGNTSMMRGGGGGGPDNNNNNISCGSSIGLGVSETREELGRENSPVSKQQEALQLLGRMVGRPGRRRRHRAAARIRWLERRSIRSWEPSRKSSCRAKWARRNGSASLGTGVRSWPNSIIL